jgi:hypothetical protein
MAHLSAFSGISAPGVLAMAPLSLRASGRRSRLISLLEEEVFLEKEGASVWAMSAGGLRA